MLQKNFKETKTSDDSATLSIPGVESISLPLVQSTCGSSGLDISALLSKTGYFSYDPSFMSTASCKSSITYINGNEGTLMHCGYSIQTLAEDYTFVDGMYLLLYGKLPSDNERKELDSELTRCMEISDVVKKVIASIPRESHPMSILLAAISAMASDSESGKTPDLTFGINAIAKVVASSAYIYRYITNQECIEPLPELSFVSNISRALFSGNDLYESNRQSIDDTISRILILHMDHEQNASTSTVRMVASTDSNFFATILSGVCALWGKLHGGANEAVIKMLHQIGSVDNIPEYLEKTKDKESQCKLMGFGHRVYKNYDPRAQAIKKSCDTILSFLPKDGLKQNLKIAQQLESLALSDEYFIKRKLFPNVDFYSGIIYEALEIPSSYFTVMFAMARVSGWVAQSLEFLSSDNTKISRPRQVYTGKVNIK